MATAGDHNLIINVHRNPNLLQVIPNRMKAIHTENSAVIRTARIHLITLVLCLVLGISVGVLLGTNPSKDTAFMCEFLIAMFTSLILMLSIHIWTLCRCHEFMRVLLRREKRWLERLLPSNPENIYEPENGTRFARIAALWRRELEKSVFSRSSIPRNGLWIHKDPIDLMPNAAPRPEEHISLVSQLGR